VTAIVAPRRPAEPSRQFAGGARHAALAQILAHAHEKRRNRPKKRSIPQE
jgi:hypothetical protein